MAAAKKKTKQVMDIAKPGTTPSAATSRPIIVGHGTKMADPMVRETRDEEETASPALVSKSKTIQPPSASADTEEDKDTPQSSDTKTDDAPEKNDTEEESVVIDAVIGQVSDKKKSSKEGEEIADEMSRLQKLIDEKKYYVRIGRVRRQKGVKRLVIALFALLLIAGLGLLLLVDAGIIKTDMKLPFDLIKNPASQASPLGSAEVTTLEPAVDVPVITNEDTSAQSDQERKADIDLASKAVDLYFAQESVYPSYTDIIDPEFVALNLKDINDETQKDPEGTMRGFVAKPTSLFYSYEPLTTTGQTCNNVSAKCLKYTLTATLSDGTTYAKTNSN